MKSHADTTQTIPALWARTHFGEILKNVQSGGSRYLVEKGGIPVAGIIGAEEFHRFFEEREERFRILHELRAGLPASSEEVVLQDVDAAVKKVRGRRRGSNRS